MAIRTRFSKNGHTAETRIGSEEFVNYPGGFVDWIIHELERAEAEEAASDTDDPVTVNARQRTAELFAASDDPNWLGI